MFSKNLPHSANPVALLGWTVLALSITTLQITTAAASLHYSTYFGGTHDEGAADLAVDPIGNAYVVGTTSSPDFPLTTTQQPQTAQVAYVAKFSTDGALLYSTLIPGPCGTMGAAIAVDDAGSAYITGRSPLCLTEGSVAGVLVAKLSQTGALLYQYTFGGSLADTSAGHAIAADHAGHAYITGKAQSATRDFPTTAGAFQTNDCGGWLGGGFVAKLNPAGNGLIYSTHLCGTSSDTPTAIAIDSTGNAYVAGTTTSHDFPTVNAAQPAHRGGPVGDTGFVCKLNATGSQLIYSTYLGGSIGDSVTAIMVDAEGNSYVTGGTSGGDFPTTAGTVQSTSPFPICGLTLCSDAFVTKFSPTGALLYSTYIGGEGNDSGSGIVLDAAGNVIVAGSTASTSFPIRNALQRENAGRTDGFIMKLNPDASRILFSTHLGGGRRPGSTSLTDGSDQIAAMAFGPTGSVIVAGYTLSTNFPTTPGAFQLRGAETLCYLNIDPCGDAFVTKMSLDVTSPVPALHLDVSPAEIPLGGAITATWAGIVAPTPRDQLYLFRLGARADSTSVLAGFPTGGGSAGTLDLLLPSTLPLAHYELRLMTPDPEFPSLLRVIARSEPILIVEKPVSVRLVPVLEPGNILRLHIDGPVPEIYHVEATDTLYPPDWRPIATMKKGSGEFVDNLSPARPARYYRVSRP